MEFIKTPTGDIFRKDECEEFDADFCGAEVFFNCENQEISVQKIFEATGIMIADIHESNL